MKAIVHVTLKTEVLDPQGDAIRRSLGSLGFDGVKSARVGKIIELDLETEDRAAAEKSVTEMCEKLLRNPVIEEFSFELA